jgi:uncharacterized membrane protein (Fun14 family)
MLPSIASILSSLPVLGLGVLLGMLVSWVLGQIPRVILFVVLLALIVGIGLPSYTIPVINVTV